MFNKIILYFCIATIGMMPCLLFCSCDYERPVYASIDEIVAKFTEKEKESDGIDKFGLTKSSDMGYKNLQLLDVRSKELKEFSPLLLEYITARDIDVDTITSGSMRDPRIKKIVEFLQSDMGDALKSNCQQLYNLVACCVRQKLEAQGIEPFITKAQKEISRPIRSAIEECIKRMAKVLTCTNSKEAQVQPCQSAQVTIESIICSNPLGAQSRMVKAFNDALREIGVQEIEVANCSQMQRTTQLSALVTNPALGTIFKLCSQQDYAAALELLDKTYTNGDLLTLRFKRALDAFIRGNFTQFDPQIGDELCEVRALMLPLLRNGVCDLPCLTMFFSSRIDLVALFVVSCYLLTEPLPGIHDFRGRSLQPLIDMLCGTDEGVSRLSEGSYTALKKFLSAISISFLRDMAEASGDSDLMLGCNNLFLNAKGCITMPFYCSIKALVYALKRYNIPVIFRVMKVVGYCKDQLTDQELSVGPCSYVTTTESPKGAALIYECKSVPAGIEYRRAKMSSCDQRRCLESEKTFARMVQVYGLENIILQDAAQHDQLINPSVEMVQKINQKITGCLTSIKLMSKQAKTDLERQIICELFSQCGRLANEYQTNLDAARQANMDEERKCQQDVSASKQEEIKLIVSHVFVADAASYMDQRCKTNMCLGRRVCCV